MIFQFGVVDCPFQVIGVPSLCAGEEGQGMYIILNNLLKMVIVLAGLYTFWNLIAAGYMFLNAGGEAKAIAKAWDKIWQSLVGLIIVAGSFILAMILGYLIFGDTTALIAPRIFKP